MNKDFYINFYMNKVYKTLNVVNEKRVTEIFKFLNRKDTNFEI